jgi:hypothetical protein
MKTMGVEETVADLYGIDASRVEDQTSGGCRPAQEQAQSAREASEGYKEADLQRDVVTWAWGQGHPYDLLRAFPNDGPKQHAYGVVSGTPDLLLPVPSGDYGALWLELKVGTNDLSPAQYKQMRRLHAAGHCTAIAWTLAQARYVMTCYVEAQCECLSGW